MVYKYDVIVPLIYNRHELYTKHPNMEHRFELDSGVSHSIKVKFVTFEMPGLDEEGYTFEDSIDVKVYNTYETDDDVHGRESGRRVSPELICEINGLLVDDELYARRLAEEILDRICRELSFVFIRYNSNRHLFQPRVEAAWSRAIFKRDEYGPYVEARQTVLEKNKATETVIHVGDSVRVTDSVYLTAVSNLPASEFNLGACFLSHSCTVDYLMKEYYSALGAEMEKSKFFHLFSMIEFCEREYREHNGAVALLDKQSIDDIIDCLDKQNIIKTMKDGKDAGSERTDNKANLLSLIKKNLTEANDIGRNKKLLNILHWMKIDYFQQGGKRTLVDEVLIRELTQLRNKSFHGTAEDNDADSQYRNAVEKLMYIGELILDFVRKHEQVQLPEKKGFLIIGKR